MIFPRATVDKHGKIKLPLDRAARLDIELMHDTASGSRLTRNQRLVEHLVGSIFRLFRTFYDPHSADFRMILEMSGSATTSVNLRLHGTDGRSERTHGLPGFLR